MPNELLIYGNIYTQSSIDFITGMGEANSDEELVVRLNTDGGDVLYGWGMIAKFIEHEGPKLVKVDGKAYSMGAYFCAYADNVEALDVSSFMIHRAAYSSWFEGSEYFTDELKSQLEDVNKKLMAALKAKIDVAKFEQIKGVKLKDVFSMNGRIDVLLTAQEAKQIGLVNKISKITPKKMKAINSEMNRVAASFTGVENIEGPTSNDVEPVVASIDKTNNNNNSKNDGKMSPEEFRKQHPEAAKAMEDNAVKAERDRVNAWLKFNDIDAKAVAEGIESGENISQTAMADFSKKMFSAQALKDVKDDNPKTVETKEEKPNASGEKSELENFEAKVASDLGLNLEK